VVQRYNFLLKEVSFLTFFVPKSLDQGHAQRV